MALARHVHSATTPSDKSPWAYLDVSFRWQLCLGIVSLQILRTEGFLLVFLGATHIHSCQCSNAEILPQTNVRRNLKAIHPTSDSSEGFFSHDVYKKGVHNNVITI